MGWEALGLVELIGAMAVIASLLYLVILVRVNSENVRQSRKAQIALTVFSPDERAQKYTLALLNNPEFADLIQRGSLGEDLSETDSMRHGDWFHCLMVSHQTFYFDYIEGVESEALWIDWKRRFSQMLAMPGFVAVWLDIEVIFDEGFKNYVNDSMNVQVNSAR